MSHQIDMRAVSRETSVTDQAFRAREVITPFMLAKGLFHVKHHPHGTKRDEWMGIGRTNRLTASGRQTSASSGAFASHLTPTFHVKRARPTGRRPDDELRELPSAKRRPSNNLKYLRATAECFT